MARARNRGLRPPRQRDRPAPPLDMWEHAYYLQYRNVKAEWVDAFWNVVNREDVARRLNSVRNLNLVL